MGGTSSSTVGKGGGAFLPAGEGERKDRSVIEALLDERWTVPLKGCRMLPFGLPLAEVEPLRIMRLV